MVRTITNYACEICSCLYDTEEGAKRCEAKGTPPRPALEVGRRYRHRSKHVSGRLADLAVGPAEGRGGGHAWYATVELDPVGAPGWSPPAVAQAAGPLARILEGGPHLMEAGEAGDWVEIP